MPKRPTGFQTANLRVTAKRYSPETLLSLNLAKRVFLLFPVCGAATPEEPMTQNIEDGVVTHHWVTQALHRHGACEPFVAFHIHYLAIEQGLAVD